MKPIKLTMTAFGPYAGVQIIDFQQLQGRNLFVISGNTGSGKTFILDAICYALYGEASSSDRDGESLRSHFPQDSELLTSVELEFSLKGTNYYVKRSPKQERNARRGGGTTKSDAHAEFKCLSDSSIQPVSGVRPVTAKLVELIGLTAAQFKQIMILPQGKFRELLTTESDAREKILQKLFNTEQFSQIQELLTQKASALDKEKTALQIRLRESAKAIDTDGCPEIRPLLEGAELQLKLIMEKTTAALAVDKQTEEQCQQDISKLVIDSEKKQQDISAAEQTNKKLQEKDAAHNLVVTLTSRQPEIDAKHTRRHNARQALTVLGAEENCVTRASDLAAKKNTAAAVQTALEQSVITLTKTAAAYEAEKAKEGERNNLLIEQANLNSFRAKISDCDSKQTALSSLQQAFANQEKALIQAKTTYEQSKKAHQQCQTALDAAKDADQQYTKLKAAQQETEQICAKLQDLLEENDKLASASQICSRLQQQAAVAAKTAADNAQAYDEAQRNFLAGQAGLLAASLHAGDLCPVCGSTTHPHPAILAGNVPTEADIKDLLTKAKTSRDNQTVLADKLAKANGDQEAKKQIVARLLADLSLTFLELAANQEKAIVSLTQTELPAWQQRLANNNAALKKLAATKNQLAPLTLDLRQKESAINTAEENLARSQHDYTQLYGQVQAVQSAYDSLASELPPHIRSLTVLEKELTASKAKSAALQKSLDTAETRYNQARQEKTKRETEVTSTQTALAEAQNHDSQAKERFAAALKQAGFPTETAYLQAKLPPSSLTTLDQEISDYHKALHAAQENYSQLAVAVAGLVPIDVTALKAEKATIDSRKDQLLVAKTNLISRQTRNQQALVNIRTVSDQWETKCKEYGNWHHVSEFAKGNNPQKVSFARYVLAAFFTDIIEAANIRLRKMTDGRYYMRRIAERGKGAAQTGLEIEVFDYYTGRPRHVKVLSGGESFKASLALALGLADVVQAYAGGVHIDTMLIDEGFGTLDPESLDNAVNTLIELQHSGRLVGIISHVPELKASVEARLEVEATKDGSTAAFHIM